MKTIEVKRKNGESVELQVGDDILKLLMSKDIDPSIKSALVKSLMPESTSQSDTSVFCLAPNNQPQATSSSSTSSSSTISSSLSASTSSSSANSTSKLHIWTGDQEDMLVSLRHERNSCFNKSKNHSSLWLEISEALNSTLKCNITSTQAMNKYYSLKKRWKEVVDSGTGTEAKYFRQREMFDEVYGTRESTKPSHQIDSASSTHKQGNTQPKSLSTKVTSSKKRKSSQLVELIDNHHKEFNEKMDNHHTDKMARLDRLLDLYQKDIENK